MARCMERGGTQWDVHDGCYGDGTLIFWFFGFLLYLYTIIRRFAIFIIDTNWAGLGLA